MSNIVYLEDKIKSISASTTLTIQIKDLLKDQLNELILILKSVNELDISTINIDTYKNFGDKCWQLANCFGEYNKFINRIFYNDDSEKKKYILDNKIVSLEDMPNIIPRNAQLIINEDGTNIYNSEVKPITLNFNTIEPITSEDHIIILPGCFDNKQGMDRVALCKGLITDYLEHGKTITHIIVSGRGNGLNSGLHNGIDKQKQKVNLPPRFLINKLDASNKNTHTLSNDVYSTGYIDKKEQKYLVKYGEFNPIHKNYTHFKTEAYYMAIEVYKILEDLQISDENKPKILLESLAAETAANFVFAPFSCLYEYKGKDDTIEVKATTNEEIDVITKAFLNHLMKSNLHIISHDYHILRCINTSMQTLRPTLSDELVRTYGTMNYYCVRDNNSTKLGTSFAANYFESFTQPYYQLFFDLYGIENKGKIEYQKTNTIVLQRTTQKPNIQNDAYKFLFQLVMRLLAYHGAYLDTKGSGLRLDNLIFKVYPNILNNANFNDKLTVGGNLNIKKKTNKNKSYKNKKSRKQILK